MFLIPIIIVAGLFIVFSFAPILWRRPFWGRWGMMRRPMIHHRPMMGHRPHMGPHHRHW
jgi:hypothetical protein